MIHQKITIISRDSAEYVGTLAFRFLLLLLLAGASALSSVSPCTVFDQVYFLQSFCGYLSPVARCLSPPLICFPSLSLRHLLDLDLLGHMVIGKDRQITTGRAFFRTLPPPEHILNSAHLTTQWIGLALA